MVTCLRRNIVMTSGMFVLLNWYFIACWDDELTGGSDYRGFDEPEDEEAQGNRMGERSRWWRWLGRISFWMSVGEYPMFGLNLKTINYFSAKSDPCHLSVVCCNLSNLMWKLNFDNGVLNLTSTCGNLYHFTLIWVLWLAVGAKLKRFWQSMFWDFTGLGGECEAAGNEARAEHTRKITQLALNSCWTVCYW